MSQDEADKALADLAAGQRDVERLMYQIIQSSISLIGFGFTIHAFLNNAAAGAALTIDLDQAARRIGLGLMTLGLLNLALGVMNQTRYLRTLQRRHPFPKEASAPRAYSPRPSFIVAWSLLGIGVAALASLLVQTFS